jgi:hypothetical protein
VRRNNIYDMIITRIEGPGTPTPYNLDTNTPVTEETQMSVNVNVMKWWVNTSSHELN